MLRKVKLINVKVYDTCAECPYCQYDPHYSRGKDSGYDCYNTDSFKRIIDDYEIDTNKYKWPPIPEWCPLPNDH